MKNTAKYAFFAAAAAAVSAAVLFFTSASVGQQTPDVSGADITMSYTAKNERLTAVSLRKKDGSWLPYTNEKIQSPMRFGYIWLTVKNKSDEPLVVYFTNRTRNYYTEMLKPAQFGAVTIYRHGDIVPIAASPVRHHKAVFPITAGPRTTVEYVVEFHGMQGVCIDPSVFSPSEWLKTAVIERSISGIIAGILLFFTLMYAVTAAVNKNAYYASISFFSASVLFFFLRQSRVLLVLFSFAYPPWLYPLSIALNIVAGTLFGIQLIHDMSSTRKKILYMLLGGVVIVTSFSFAYAPFIAADILNYAAFIPAAVLLFSALPAVRSRDLQLLFTCISFMPWLAAVSYDIVTSLAGIPQAGYTEFRQPLSVICALFFLQVYRTFTEAGIRDSKIALLKQELEKARSESVSRLVKMNDITSTASVEFYHQLRQPLDGIRAAVQILRNTSSEPRIHAVCQVVLNEIEEIKRVSAGEYTAAVSEPDDEETKEFAQLENVEETASDSFQSAQICIFDPDKKNASRTKLVLQSEGFSSEIYTSQYAVLSEIAQGNVDLLIIDPSSNGEDAFSLCSHIRSLYSILRFPVLMITNYFADYLMKRGYSAGVNDFLTRPFDSSELISRVYTLLKLKEVYLQNIDLAQSEKEKNIFLYFLTHNVNTPLTLLLNRIHDLKQVRSPEKTQAVIEDIELSASEINEIVQNVLVSFRLSDGRHTVRIEEVDISIIADYMREEFKNKTALKEQSLVWIDSGEQLTAFCDRNSVKGIVYNIIDNAVKFTPVGGTVTVKMYRDAKFVHIEVCDSGPGICEEDRKKLFGRFERLSAKPTAGESSTGLGLYVAYELARMNRGILSCREKNGSGACFVLSLPLFDTENFNSKKE